MDPRHAVATAGAILASILAIWGTWQWATEPVVPKFDKLYEEHLEADADNMLAHATPVEFWEHLQFTSPILLERGFEEISTPQEDGFVQYLEDRQLRRKLTFAAAGLVAALSSVVWLFWPKPLA